MMALPPEIAAIKARLRQLMLNPITDNVVGCLIVASVALLFIDLLLPETLWTAVLGTAVNLLFLLELGVRLWIARNRMRHLRNYWLDWLSLLPLLLPDLGWLRALRLLRLFRLGVLMRQSNRRIGSFFRRTSGEQLTILCVLLVVIVSVTLALVGSEPAFASLEDTIWWSILSTVAGEPIGETPSGTLGRVMTLVIMVGGLTIFALFTGTVTAVITEKLRTGFTNTMDTIEEIDNHILIFGWNRSGKTLLEELASSQDFRDHIKVVVAEQRPDFGLLESDPHIYFIEGDYTTTDVLRRAGVARASRAILLADRSIPTRSDQDRDARTILAALMIEKLRPGIFTCAELLSRENEQHLRLAGIEEVVIGDEYSGTILATSARVRGVTHIADEIFSAQYGNQIYKREIRGDWAGKTFIDLQAHVKREFDALLIAIESARPRDSVAEGSPQPLTPYSLTSTNPPADHRLVIGDRLIVLAKAPPTW